MKLIQQCWPIQQTLNVLNDKGQICEAMKESAPMKATKTKNGKGPNHNQEKLLLQEGTEIRCMYCRIHYLHCLILYMLLMIFSSSGKITDTTNYTFCYDKLW
jgi:hypothetical protein